MTKNRISSNRHVKWVDVLTRGLGQELLILPLIEETDGQLAKLFQNCRENNINKTRVSVNVVDVKQTRAYTYTLQEYSQ